MNEIIRLIEKIIVEFMEKYDAHMKFFCHDHTQKWQSHLILSLTIFYWLQFKILCLKIFLNEV